MQRTSAPVRGVQCDWRSQEGWGGCTQHILFLACRAAHHDRWARSFCVRVQRQYDADPLVLRMSTYRMWGLSDCQPTVCGVFGGQCAASGQNHQSTQHAPPQYVLLVSPVFALLLAQCCLVMTLQLAAEKGSHGVNHTLASDRSRNVETHPQSYGATPSGAMEPRPRSCCDMPCCCQQDGWESWDHAPSPLVNNAVLLPTGWSPSR